MKKTEGSEELERLAVETDEKGRFSVRVEAGSEIAVYWRFGAKKNYLIDIEWLRKEASEEVLFRKITKDEEDVVLKIKVRWTYTLAGKVVDPYGRPVRKARVLFANYTPLVQTDREGRFLLKTAPENENFELLVVSRDSTLAKLVRVKPNTKEITVSLEPTITIRGKAVCEDGTPARGLRFQVLPFINGQMVFVENLPTSRLFKASESGTFELKSVCNGLRYVALWYAGPQFNSEYERGREIFSVEKGREVILKVKRFKDDWDSPGNICVSKETRCKDLTNYCLDAQDNFVVCDGARKRIMIISPADKLLVTWKLDFTPQAVACRPDGKVVVSGAGKIALLEKNGKVLREARLKGDTTTCVGVWGKDIFVCVRRRTGYAIYRLDEKLKKQKLIIRGLSGCCGQLDFALKDGVIYVAANTRFKVVKYDRNGRKLGSFGKRHRKKGDNGFDGCCEPKNVCFDSRGFLYTAESEGRCVKKFTPEGKFIAHMGTCKGIRGCVRVTVAVNKACEKIYMLDTGRNIIRLVRKKAAGTASR